MIRKLLAFLLNLGFVDKIFQGNSDPFQAISQFALNCAENLMWCRFFPQQIAGAKQQVSTVSAFIVSRMMV